MHRFAKLAAAIAAAILISGCTLNPFASKSEQPPAAPSSQVTTVQEPTPEPDDSGSATSSPQSVFAQAFSGDYYSRFGTYPTDEQIASSERFGIKACQALESGALTWNEVTAIVIEGGKDLSKAAMERYVFALGYSIGFHCPDQVPA